MKVERRAPALLVALAVLAGGCGKRAKDERAPKERTSSSVLYRARAGDLAIVGATVIPMDREGTLPDTTILVRGDQIIAVAPAAQVDPSPGTVIDAHGTFVLPGLADMHVHLQGKEDLPLFLLEGVTTVRNLFGFPQHLRWRDAIAKGELDGPTLLTAGPIVDGDPPTWPGSAVVTTADGARAEVRAQKQAGYDWIKVYGGLPADAYAAVLDEAAAQGLPVAGHVPKAVGIDAVIAAAATGRGQRSIEHLDGYVPMKGDLPTTSLVDATVKAGVWNVPTLVVTDRFGHLDDPAQLAGTRGLDLVAPALRAAWDPKQDFRLKTWTPETFAAHRERNVLRRQLVGELARAGAHLALGTDTGNPYVVPGFAVHDELALLVASGLTPWQALRVATVGGAQLAQRPGASGMVIAGARADLLIVDRDPTVDVGNVFDPAIVIVRGKVHRHAELLAAAKPAPPPADPLAALPSLASEGSSVVTARYAVLQGQQTLGGERIAIGTGAGGALIVNGQAAYLPPQEVTFAYRATADALDLTTDSLSPPHVSVVRTASGIAATQDGGAPVEVAAEASTVIAPQTIAEFVWYAHALADLPIGQARTLTAAEVMTDGRLRLDAGRFTFTRAADDRGRRVYAIAGTHGRLDLTGRLVVDADGAPYEVTVTVKFGTFVTRRVAAP